jgi:GntR family transcriptional repressor for pyruvate dehydrogenase complex
VVVKNVNSLIIKKEIDMLKKIEKTKIYEIAVNQIKDQIENGTWVVGSRLPSERVLAEKLGVGRPSIREALRVLEVMGYIEIKPGQGNFVTKPNSDDRRAKVLQSMLQEDANVVELLEVREILEPQIAYLAAQSASEKDIHVLEGILDQMDKHNNRGESTFEDNIEFHLAIARSVDNKVLFQVQKLLLKSSRETVARYFQVPGRNAKSLVGHRVILDAIRDGNSELARDLMLQHLRARLIEPNNNHLGANKTKEV